VNGIERKLIYKHSIVLQYQEFWYDWSQSCTQELCDSIMTADGIKDRILDAVLVRKREAERVWVFRGRRWKRHLSVQLTRGRVNSLILIEPMYDSINVHENNKRNCSLPAFMFIMNT
jgi:hypothetical protein